MGIRIRNLRPVGRVNRLPQPFRAAAYVAVAFLALGGSGCGGEADPRERARELYRSYRSAEDERTAAEARLRQAFVDIAAAAETHRDFLARAAVERGRVAVEDIDRLLDLELDAAEALTQFEDVARDAEKLRKGIGTTRASLRLFERELDIAADDPFLTKRANVVAVRTLSRRAAKLAVDGELEIRRADRAIALALGLEPPLDPNLE